jgi:hypothetical protein
VFVFPCAPLARLSSKVRIMEGMSGCSSKPTLSGKLTSHAAIRRMPRAPDSRHYAGDPQCWRIGRFSSQMRVFPLEAPKRRSPSRRGYAGWEPVRFPCADLSPGLQCILIAADADVERCLTKATSLKLGLLSPWWVALFGCERHRAFYRLSGKTADAHGDPLRLLCSPLVV